MPRPWCRPGPSLARSRWRRIDACSIFSRVRSDANSLYDVEFDALLGSYCNTLSLVRFLELGLSVACVCTKFPELAYMNEGRVQFEVHQPLIARDGPHPIEQPTHNYMTKIIDRRALNAAFSLATEAIALLTGRPWTGRVSARIASCAPSNNSLATSGRPRGI